MRDCVTHHICACQERKLRELEDQLAEARDVCAAAEETEHQLRARIRNLEAQLGTLGIRRRSGRCKLKKVPQG